MKQPPQHSWMEPGWSSSDPQPRPYGWAYGEDQGDHHVRQFRKDRQRDAALDSDTAVMHLAMGLRNWSVPMLQGILEDQAKDRAARRRVEAMLAAGVRSVKIK